MTATVEQVRSLPVAVALPAERALFIRRTYAHLAGAVGLFVGLEYVLLPSSFAKAMMQFVSTSRYSWLMILGGFMAAGWLARTMIAGAKTRSMQYAGLGVYVVAEALIFIPLLYIAVYFSSPKVLPSAALITAALFTGLSAVAITTRKDFSFLGGILTVGGVIALGLIVAGVIFGFNLGLAFSGGMVLLAAGSILYDTSKIVRDYSTDDYVGASLQLFASVMLMFWYVLRIMMRVSRR
ncbi:MAG: Bax inhibitor-1/YccA family protein [Chitinispirillaceae bacterium]|nr:Bax inhibitor-1/YccA family protein [Chitinispirillaceae bacterium]